VIVGPGGAGACNGFCLRLLGKKCCDTGGMLGREFCQRQGVGVGPGGVGACNGFGLRLLGKKCCDTDDTLGRVLRLGDGLLTALRNPLQCCEGREPLKPRESEGSNGFMDRGLQLELISYPLFSLFYRRQRQAVDPSQVQRQVCTQSGIAYSKRPFVKWP